MEGCDLARLWKGGKKGYLSPLMQAKAWGLSEAGVPHDGICRGWPTRPNLCRNLGPLQEPTISPQHLRPQEP